MTNRNGPKCGGKLHNRDGTCTLPAGWGTDHVGYGRCRKHLGTTPNVAKAAERERLDAEAGKVLAQLDVQPVTDPLTALAKLAGQVVAWKDATAHLVNKLTSLRYSAESGEHLRAEVALWERAMDRCEKVLTAMARLDIDGRLAAISEEQGHLVAGVLRSALADLGLSAAVQQAAGERVAHHLRAAADRQRRELGGVTRR